MIQALEMTGDADNYQSRLLVFHSLQNIFVAFFFIAIPFLFYPVTFNCQRTNADGAKEVVQCTEFTGGCEDMNINDGLSPNSLTREFHLYCENLILKDLAGTIFFVVGGIATMLFGHYSDHHGRRMPCFWSLFIPAIALFAGSYVDNYFLFLIAFGLCGFAFPYVNLCFVHMNESSGDHFRVLSTILIDISFNVGQCLFVGLVYFELDWRFISRWFIATPTLLSCIFYLWMYETPRFLYAIGEYSESKEVLKKIASINNKPYVEFHFPEEVGKTRDLVKMGQQDKINYFDLWRYISLRKTTFLLCIISASVHFCYFGLFFAIDELGPNISLNVFVLSLGDVLGCALGIPVAEHCRRKISICIYYILIAIISFTFFFFELPDECRPLEEFCDEKIILTSLLFVDRIFISFCWTMFIVHSIELYPTPIRSIGISFTLFFGRILGGSTAPLILDEFKILTGLNPMMCFSVAGVAAAVTVLFTRETFGERLVDTIEELEEHHAKEEAESEGKPSSAPAPPPQVKSQKLSFRLGQFLRYVL
eukprot:TRINITY_DN9719_c0_g1_i5.p1 TRINITY_DN9719_c0_g1~~TRINITY_DN9719_c0_g1_i5.p1  ORF type:complete len:536 (+),score=75.87 TRINITY_DN9719_c0_g1_i5:66-1673(+)